ncbi:MAG: IS982 family transposase [Capnocytophaga sp.]|uniref:IS982 family transposase n=1 Tax=Capnocytophaga sp. TaxID=44737 RepID=UPI003FA14C60
MLSNYKVTEIFFIIDEFDKNFEKIVSDNSLMQDTTLKQRNRKTTLSDSEVMTILILFHSSHYRDLKHYYINLVKNHMKKEFPQTVSYNRFVELQKKVVVKLAILLKIYCLEKCNGISYIDSTAIRVCHIKREKQHKVFKGLVQKGQCSFGWFFGFKLHLIINDKGEILDFIITPGNVDGRKPLSDMNLHKRIFGKLFGDKRYISKDLFEQLFVDGIHLISKIKKNMKNSLMLLQDKIVLKKRALIETVNDELKNICQVEHIRHRSFDNFITNLLSELIAYFFFDKKPSINLHKDIVDVKRLAPA